MSRFLEFGHSSRPVVVKNAICTEAVLNSELLLYHYHLKSYVANFEAHFRARNPSPSKCNIKCPILSSRLLSDQLANLMWLFIYYNRRHKTASLNISNMHMAKFSSYHISKQDYHEAASTLSLIQRFYDIDIKKLLAEGSAIFEPNTAYVKSNNVSRLGCADIIYLGMAAIVQGWVSDGMHWIKQLDHIYSHVIFKLPLLANLLKSVKSHSHATGNMASTEIAYEKVNFKLPVAFKNFKNGEHRTLDQSSIRNTREVCGDNYVSLCRGDIPPWKQNTAVLNRALMCRYTISSSPYLTLGPFHSEEMNKELPISLFHNFLSGKEIRHFLNLGAEGERSQILEELQSRGKYETPLLFRNSYQKTFDEIKYSNFEIEPHADIINTSQKIRKDSFLRYQTYPLFPSGTITDQLVYRVTKRIEAATGLTVDGPLASEGYTVVNYVPGGLYRTHTDAFGDDVKHFDFNLNGQNMHSFVSGDRLATFLLYLKTPYLRGSTSFPLLGINIHVNPGTAIFWTNLYNTGRINRMSAHAGCPIVSGSKCIANKWILYNANFKKFPCKVENISSKNNFSM